MKIACISLGCPKNQVDLDVMVHILLSAGHETVADLAEADVILESAARSKSPVIWVENKTLCSPSSMYSERI